MPTEDLSYFQEEEFKRNLSLYEQMLQSGQSVYLEADELTDIAEYYLVKNESEKAMACINYALSLHPGSVDPLIFLARQKMFEGDIQGAKNIRNSISDTNDREVIFLDAELMLREGKEEEAEAFMTQKSKEEEEDLALIRRVFRHEIPAVEECLNELYTAEWEEHVRTESLKKLKADILIAENHPEEAAALLNHLLDINPYNINAWHSLGEAYFLLEDYSKVLETTDFAMAIDEQDSQALLMKANSQLQLQNFEEAHSLFLKYIEKHNPNEVPYIFDGVCLMAMENYNEALGRLLKAEELSQGYSPEQQHIYANLSEVYSKMHQPQKAFEYIEKIKEINPDYETDLHKGHVLMQNGRVAEAFGYYHSFIQSHKDPMEARILVGMSLLHNKAYDDAREYFLFVMEHDNKGHENYPKVYACLAYCALMQNRYQEFLDNLKIACEKAPEDLEYSIGQYIPEEVEPKDFYHYVITHSDRFIHFDPNQ